LAYSLLMSQLRQSCAREWALHRLTTIGEACRAMLRENLRATLAWAIQQVTEKERPFGHVIAQLGLC
ncbi:MAG TPA: IS701 family transposase, partial [Isosphaeraceae bacterium]|nr:IS701 family transposase [Isosphaeraceae bacterium]